MTTSKTYPNYRFIKLELEDRKNLEELFKTGKFDVVVNLAAQAGVRYSVTNPHVYVDSNVVGFINLLENCWYNNINHLVYASSSSVYGLNESIPFSTSQNVDHPMSLYAATKKVTSGWRMCIVTFLSYLLPAYVSLLFMAPRAIQIWRFSFYKSNFRRQDLMQAPTMI
jgi:nucleoside-diphosphate-sugar epimerase